MTGPKEYHIKKVWRCGIKRWLVLKQGNPIEVARFTLKREAVAWILEQEKKDFDSAPKQRA